jgi:hypothetical protein
MLFYFQSCVLIKTHCKFLPTVNRSSLTTGRDLSWDKVVISKLLPNTGNAIPLKFYTAFDGVYVTVWRFIERCKSDKVIALFKLFYQVLLNSVLALIFL